MFVVVVNAYSLRQTNLFSEDEARYGIHGGSAETSMMLHIRPDLVDMSKAQDFAPMAEQLAEDFQYLTPTGPTRFAWQAQDLNPAGVVGTPSTPIYARRTTH